MGAVSGRANWKTLLLLLCLVLTIALAIAALRGWLRVLHSERLAEVNRPSDVPLAVDKTLGVTADLSRLGPEAQEQALSAMEATGLRWLRQRFGWDAIEYEPGTYQWGVWDDIVDGAARHNLRLIAVLDGSPTWARGEEDADNPLAPPSETRDFGSFAAAFAGRYGDRVDHYQIWDEPNIWPHWGARWVDPAAYARLLREGAIQVRTADAQATVLAAALAPNVEPGGANMSELAFLDALYNQKAAEWFDVVVAQPYGFDDPLSAPAERGKLNWARVALLREVMLSHGDASTAVWAVSFAWTEEQARNQAQDLPGVVAASIEGARRNWPWMGPMLWAAWSPTDAHGQYALTNSAGQPSEVSDTLGALATSQGVAYPGAYPADHASGRFEGSWRVTPSGADIGASDDRLTITFWGTRLDLTVRRGDYRAFLYVSIDGQPGNALPQDRDGRSFLVLYDPLNEVGTVPLARGLSEGVHTAQVVAERGWQQWAIVGWRVWREADQASVWLPALLSFLAIALMALAICLSWPNRADLINACKALVARYRALDGRLSLLITAVAALAHYLVVGTPTSLVTLAILGMLLALRPEMGLPLIAFALPFYQPGKPLLGKVFSMVEILTVLTTLGWAINAALKATQQLSGRMQSRSRYSLGLPRLTALDWGVLGLVVVGALSLLWSEHLREASREFRTVLLEAALFYALLRLLVRGRRSAWTLMDAWVLGGFAIAVVGVLQWILGESLITADGVWRVRGFYGSPNNLALYLGRLLPLGVALALWGRDVTRRWFYAIAALVMAAAIALTYSRGAWLLGVPASLLFLSGLRGRRQFLAMASVVLLGAVVLVFLPGTGRVLSLASAGQGATFLRLQLWQSSWDMIRDHPILGIGLDNFLYYYRTQYVMPSAWEEFNLSHPHNFVLDFWLRLGVGGLLVLGWLLIAFFRQGRRTYRGLAEGDERLAASGLMAGVVALIAHGLVDNAFFLMDLAFAFMLALALIQVLGEGLCEP